MNRSKERRWRFWASRTCENRRLDNPLIVPDALSFLTYRAMERERARDSTAFRRTCGRTAFALLYFSYHVMVGLGTIFIAVMVMAAFLAVARKLFESRWMLWMLMLCAPLPLHREHGGMDDGGIGPAAVADLRADADVGGRVAERCRGERVVHADRIHGNVRRAGDSVAVSGVARNRNGPESRRTWTRPASRSYRNS